MRRIFYTLVLSLLVTFTAMAQSNVVFKSQFTYDIEISDIWGYQAPDGTEYALVGVDNGISIVQISEGGINLQEVAFIEDGIVNHWRDIKTWSHYAYCITEGGGGVLIIDLSDLPNSVNTTNWAIEGHSTSHNIFIDEKGYAYVVGVNVGAGGVLIADLNPDPWNPVLVGQYQDAYVHDVYVKDDLMWTAEINDGVFSIVNISDRSNPSRIASQHTPNNFAHNIWLNDEGTIAYTTDEVGSAYIAAYDVSNWFDIKETDRVQSSPGEGVIPHNTFVVNSDFLVTSYYADGAVIHDATYPDNIIQVGHYDTSPTSGGGFSGCWGVYPFLPSGLLLATDQGEGLFVLEPLYTKAAYLHGNVVEQGTGTAIDGAIVEIDGVGASVTQSDLNGAFKTGVGEGGVFSITVRKPGYEAVTLSDQVLLNGELSEITIEMIKLETFAFGFNIEDPNGNGVEGVSVSVSNEFFDFLTTTDANGRVDFDELFEDTYTIVAFKWGFRSTGIEGAIIGPDTDPASFDFSLEPGYYDDFATDAGWISSGSSGTGGEWEWGVPVEASVQGFTTQLGVDVFTDLGNKCYVTGNSSDFLDMVNGGSVELKSPVFNLANYSDPVLKFSYWIANFSQAGAGNDQLNAFLIDADGNALALETFVDDGSSAVEIIWKDASFSLNEVEGFDQTKDYQLGLTATADFNQFELFEAGLDAFEITGANPISNVEQLEITSLEISPNPATDEVRLLIPEELNNSTVQIYDLAGKNVLTTPVTSNEAFSVKELPQGTYIFKVSNDNYYASGKIVKE